MYKIAFFCIPAYGHTNPTIEVVKELVARGNEVWYFSFAEFKDKIESAGHTSSVVMITICIWISMMMIQLTLARISGLQ